MASYSLSWLGLASYSLEPTIVNCLSWEYKNIVLYILTLILQLTQLSIVCPTISLVLPLLSVLLHMPLYLILSKLLQLGLSCDPILVILIVSQISFCWIDEWIVEYTLVNPLCLLYLVPFQFCHFYISWFLLPMFF